MDATPTVILDADFSLQLDALLSMEELASTPFVRLFNTDFEFVYT